MAHVLGTVEAPRYVFERDYWLKIEDRNAACTAKLLGRACPFIIKNDKKQWLGGIDEDLFFRNRFFGIGYDAADERETLKIAAECRVERQKHVALGQAYPFCIENDKEQFLEDVDEDYYHAHGFFGNNFDAPHRRKALKAEAERRVRKQKHVALVQACPLIIKNDRKQFSEDIDEDYYLNNRFIGYDYDAPTEEEARELEAEAAERRIREKKQVSSNAHFNLRNRLICYRSLDIDTLRTFAEMRRLKSGKKRAQLCYILETADKNPTFTRFNDLPLELREQVYTAYFAHFNNLRLPLGCQQPPLTRANRQLRAESLPLFYGNCYFNLRLRDMFTSSELRKEVALILGHIQLQPQLLKHLRHLTFKIAEFETFFSFHLDVAIDISLPGDTYSLTIEYPDIWNKRPANERGRKLLEDRLNATMTGVVSRPERRGWCVKDIEELLKIAQEMSKWQWDSIGTKSIRYINDFRQRICFAIHRGALSDNIDVPIARLGTLQDRHRPESFPPWTSSTDPNGIFGEVVYDGVHSTDTQVVFS